MQPTAIQQRALWTAGCSVVVGPIEASGDYLGELLWNPLQTPTGPTGDSTTTWGTMVDFIA
eukprot:3067705-Lingulodinium_polyedra.AAC.1